MKTILVPTDFSPASMNAYRFAVDYALRAKAEVVVVHVIDIPVLNETVLFPPYLYAQDMFRESMDNSHLIYDKMKRLYPANVPVSFKPIHNDLITGLSDLVRTKDVDLVIMSTHGAGGLEEFISGTPTKKIARYLPVPVLAVAGDSRVNEIKDIIFPNTLETDQEHLIERVRGLQTILNARLHLLFVRTPTSEHSEKESIRLLEQFAFYYELKNFTINSRVANAERDGILSFAREIEGSMIAMGTHGRTGFNHLIKGSIAESVLVRFDFPVWVSKLC
jgi:nucleotide-binding universal stress UspA family protein